ncbi:MAG: hypothetical protein IK105_10640 [Thermoguttaceae bacterium]|nr:hypothetical protein [Thermoguttaceae bacterium]
MRLLVVSASYWSNWGCFGSTYSSIFGGIPNLEIAHVYFNLTLPAADAPANVVRFFKIGTKAAVKSAFTRRYVGEEVARRAAADVASREYTDCTAREKRLIDFFRRNHWTWLKRLNYWLIARFGKWRTPQLDAFVDDFKPDAIWVDTGPVMPTLAMALYLKERTGLPLIGFVFDEHYSLRRLSFSPAFWLYRFANRRLIRRVIHESAAFYVISEGQRDYYRRKFGKECRVLTRCADFSGDPTPIPERSADRPLSLVYTGNLGNGRYKSLITVGEAIKKAGLDAQLDVYCSQPISDRLKRRLESSGSVRFRGAIPGTEIASIQRAADVLVLAEGDSLGYRLRTRDAFSTKIVDYLHAARPVLAVGSKEMNSVAYFERHNCGLTAETADEAADALRRLAADPELARRLADAAWKTGRAFHDTSAVHDVLVRRLAELTENGLRTDSAKSNKD